MAIKVIEAPEPKERIYPIVVECVRHPELIVLMCGAGKGVCLAPKDHPSYGMFSVGWIRNLKEWTPTCVTIDSIGVM